MVRFSIFGIQVEVQPFFWLTMVLIGSGFGRGLTGSSLELLFIALFVIAGFISILVHELGHALTAKANGAQAPYIVLQAFGGYAAYPSGIMNRTRHAPSTSSSNTGGSLAIGSPPSCMTGTVIGSFSPSRDLAKM